MPEPAMLDYFYGDEAEQYTFYRIPKVLFTDPSYRRISSDAKILYGLMLDRMGLSVRNGWLDDCNRVFIYTITLGGLVSGEGISRWCGDADSSRRSFLENGVAYYVLDTMDLQMFADHTVYMAVYQGFVPTYQDFPMGEDGTITMRDGMVGALFTLPLDADKADPAAAEAFVRGTGLTFETPEGKETEPSRWDAEIIPG